MREILHFPWECLLMQLCLRPFQGQIHVASSVFTTLHSTCQLAYWVMFIHDKRQLMQYPWTHMNPMNYVLKCFLVTWVTSSLTYCRTTRLECIWRICHSFTCCLFASKSGLICVGLGWAPLPRALRDKSCICYASSFDASQLKTSFWHLTTSVFQ